MKDLCGGDSASCWLVLLRPEDANIDERGFDALMTVDMHLNLQVVVYRTEADARST